MARMLVCYYSRTEHTQHMAEKIGQGAGQVDGVEVDVKAVGEVKADSLLEYDAIVLGSPTYYGTMSWEMKRLIDETISLHGRLAGKVGGAFTSSANVAGGNETTIMDLIKALLIHGMIIPGMHQGDHYGPVAIGDVDDRAAKGCDRLGRMVAQLAVKLHG